MIRWRIFPHRVYNIENMVWLCWAFITPPTPGLKQYLGRRKAALPHLCSPPKAQGADPNSLDVAILRPRCPQTISFSCLPVASITELSHQFRHLSHQFRHLSHQFRQVSHLLRRLSHQFKFYRVRHAIHSPVQSLTSTGTVKTRLLTQTKKKIHIFVKFHRKCSILNYHLQFLKNP
jgi:hypothetical protein